MNYKETLDLISRDIWTLVPGQNQLISNADNLSIYQRNLFGGIIKSFSNDFKVLKLYLGDDNFTFFVRKFILDVKVNSLKLSEVSLAFPNFLENNIDIHQDELIKPLAQIDRLWSSNTQSRSIDVPFGMTLYWSKLESKLDTKDIIINLEKLESVRLDIIEGEKRLLVDHR